METKEPITDYSLLDQDASYSYADYLRWQFKERVELIKGKIFKMSPAANSNHQRVSANVLHVFLNYLAKSPCQLFHAPFDVRLFPLKSGKDQTIVQPDICVICDSEKINKQGCFGAPDLIIEILSESNSKHDLDTKFKLYESAGVKEYWIADPFNKLVLVYVLENNLYRGLKPFTEGEFVNSNLFVDLNLTIDEIFEGLLS